MIKLHQRAALDFNVEIFILAIDLNIYVHYVDKITPHDLNSKPINNKRKKGLPLKVTSENFIDTHSRKQYVFVSGSGFLQAFFYLFMLES